MRKLFVLLAGVVLSALMFTACQEDQGAQSEKMISQQVLDRIWQLGFSNENVQKIEEGYLVEGDIILTEEDLSVNIDPITLIYAAEEQYRTNNLVGGLPRVITVSMDANLTATTGYPAALTETLARYNAETLGLTFTHVGTAGGEIHFKKQAGNFLASAGFPTNSGNPYSLIKLNSNAIGSGSSTQFVNYCATIMAHEMGHCIGFRHTDYMNRAYSCGSGGNEGAGNVGAVHIPGTPTGPDNASWMLSCIGNLQNRPFNPNDKDALDYLY
jgi:hypothetical protein